MYLKRLELFGFKSFADKTVLNFEPGITAVVGPNGCGKSNIFDSIRWVLGEQSAKELRGSSMEDVIFNGTEKKPSLGFAEVSLTFANQRRELSIQEDDVTITRRLFRSGESEYLINKNISRLKDIQELLMGTGLGSETYSLVQQGRVDFLVMARPEERRSIIDEASGISKYKAKRREALSKLEDTEENLLRINDIAVEVKRQISSIERQAHKAKKYKDEFEKLKGLEIRLAKHQLIFSSRKKEENRIIQEELRAQQADLNKKLEEINDLFKGETDAFNEIVQKLNDCRTEEIKIDGQIDLRLRQIEFNRERIENLHISEKKFLEQKQELIERCCFQQKKMEEFKQNLITIAEAATLHQKALKEKQDHLGDLEKFIKETKEKIRENEEKILNLTSQQVSIRNSVTDTMKEIQGALARKRRLELEEEKVILEKQEIEEKLQNAQSQMASLRNHLDELQKNKTQESQAINLLRTEMTQVTATIDELERKRLFLKSQKEFIEKLQVQYQDIPDPVVEGRLIVASAPSGDRKGILGKVKEFKTLTDASGPLYEVICETKFIELDPQQIISRINNVSLQIESLMTRKEDLNAQFAERTAILHRIEGEIQYKEKNCSILEVQRSDILVGKNKLTTELELIATELKEVKESLSLLKNREDEFNYQLDTLNQDISWCQMDIKNKQVLITQTLQEKESTTVGIAQLEAEIEAGKDKLKSQQENFVMFSETLDNLLEEIKKIEDELGLQSHKKEQFEHEIISLQAKSEELTREKVSFKESLAEFETKKQSQMQEINRIRERMSQLEEQQKPLEQSIHQKQLSEQELLFQEQSLKDRLLQTYKISWEEILTAQPLSLQQQDKLLESQEVAEGSLQSPQMSDLELVAAPMSEVPPIDIEEVIDPEALKQEIEYFKKRCDSFGNVNMVAIEEFDQLKERFEFLTKQQSDLLEAKSQLMSAITKINRTTREMFMETFQKVNEEFRNHFRLLFGGGESQLILLDPENVLESGIEIVARPPGKKLQNISLLSGGENSLTAIALVFGIFKVNPSPFCVLDEIDAALDESNVMRFSYLLKEFVKLTQIVIVTHNKKTIASANVMYGITMPEMGISKIVSVKFANQESKAEPETVAAGV